MELRDCLCEWEFTIQFGCSLFDVDPPSSTRGRAETHRHDGTLVVEEGVLGEGRVEEREGGTVLDEERRGGPLIPMSLASAHVVLYHVVCAGCRPFPIKVQHFPLEGRVTSLLS